MNFHQDDLSGVRDTSGQVAVFVIKFTGGRVSEKRSSVWETWSFKYEKDT